jgi:type I restriction enzyme S subunit
MNTPELVGNCGYVDSDYDNLFLPDRLWIANFDDVRSAHVKFVWYLLISKMIIAMTGMLATGTSGSMKNLAQDKFLSIQIALPPLTEQRAIADYLDAQTTALDAQKKNLEKSIDLLREYRASLITHAVTGKIDVRDFVPAR